MLLLLSGVALGQVLDLNFSHQDHYPNAWGGDTNKFQMKNGYLQSQSKQVNDLFQIYRRIDADTVFEFNCEVELNLKTSSLNYMVLSLEGAENDTTSYYIKLGGSKDNLSLIRSQNQVDQVIYEGTDRISEDAHLWLRLSMDQNQILYLSYKEKDSSKYTEVYRMRHSLVIPYRIGIQIKQSTATFHQQHFIHQIYLGPIRTDTIPPRITQVKSINRNQWLFKFNEDVSLLGAELLINAQPFMCETINKHSCLVTFPHKLAEKWYDVSIRGVQDSSGNMLVDSSFTFLHYISKAIPKQAIVVNELLFDPRPDGIDFIELYNNSDSIFDLRDLNIGRMQDAHFTDEARLSTTSIPFLSKSYLLLSSNDSIICSHYSCPKSRFTVNMNIPKMNNDTGNIVLFTQQHTVDSVHYSEEWHTELLSTTEGVSLERINPAGPSTLSDNWHSANSLSGSATPATQNSMFRKSQLASGFELDYKLISPDGDGIHDLLFLNYTQDKPSYLSSYIYSLDGKLIWQWHHNELLSFQGSLKWDLLTGDGLLPSGHYILFLKGFNFDGELIRKKLAFTVASQY